MIRQEDKWTKTFRDRLEGWEEPVPQGLWEDLAEELKTDVPMKVVPWWRRRQAVVAVAALLLAVTSLLWWRVDVTPGTEANPSGMVVAEQTPAPEVSGSPAAPAPAEVPLKLPAREWLATTVRPRAIPAEPVAVKEEAPDKSVEAPETPEARKEADTPAPVVVRERRSQPSGRTATTSVRRGKASRWSVGLMAGNTPLNYTDGYSGYGRLSPGGMERGGSNSRSGNQGAYEQILFNNLYQSNVTSDVEHRTPVSFGLSVRFSVAPKWSVESGVFYTLLSSELRSGNADYWYKDEQRLHYVGVPLKVSRELWSNRRFLVYASVGGAVEKCVDGSLSTLYSAGAQGTESERRDLDVDRLQFSLTAAAGAQFKLNDYLGFYLEPGLAYYPDDGSEMQTIRKEHPLNFNIQLGFRLTFGK